MKEKRAERNSVAPFFQNEWKKIADVTQTTLLTHLLMPSFKEYVVDNAMFYFDGQKVKL